MVVNGFSDLEISTALQVFNTLPDFVCWKNTDLKYVMVNNATAELFGFKSSSISSQLITDFDLKCDASALANKFQSDDNYVLQTGNDLTIFNLCKYEQDEWKLLFGRKSLLRNDRKEKKGIYGRFLDVTDCPTFKMILGICGIDQKKWGKNTDSLNQVTYVVKDQLDLFNLSTRESEIIFHLIRGKTAKEIARLTKLSFRTVEKHLDRIKIKMDCHSKSQLIEKALTLGISGFLPSALFYLPNNRTGDDD